MGKRARRRVSPDVCKRVYDRWLGGATQRQIGEEFGLSYDQVHQIVTLMNRGGVDDGYGPREVRHEGLRKYLARNGLSVRQLAKGCGIPEPTIYNALCEERENGPSKRVIDAILAYTGLKYEEAFGTPARKGGTNGGADP